MTDWELEECIQDALGWERGLDAPEIGVSVKSDVVTLWGDVTTSERAAAERVALALFAITALANAVRMHSASTRDPTDAEVAQAALSALDWNSLVPDGKITVTVSDAWITLEGCLEWEYQRSAATNAVRNLPGVRGVTNGIVLEPHRRGNGVEFASCSDRAPRSGLPVPRKAVA